MLQNLYRTAFFLGVLLAAAAGTAQGQVRIGLQVMPQFTGLSNPDDVADNGVIRQTTMTFGVGLNFGYQFNKNWEAELNLIYAPIGQDYQVRQSDGNFLGYETRLTYVRVPLLVSYRIPQKKRGAFRISAGPQFNILADAQQLEGGQDLVIPAGAEITLTDRYKAFGISAVLGVGYDFRMSDNLALVTGVRAEYGFTDVEDKTVQWRNPAVGNAPLTNYYDDVYGPGRSNTTQWAVSFVLGVSYLLGSRSEDLRYEW